MQRRVIAVPIGFPVVVNVLGALLVSLGIILLVAHNWDDLSRFSKTIFAFIPLLVGQGMCAYTLIKKKNSAAWRECSAVVLFFAIATSISLVSQTYHISGTMSGFLLTWMLLAAPVILPYAFFGCSIAIYRRHYLVCVRVRIFYLFRPANAILLLAFTGGVDPPLLALFPAQPKQ